MSAPPWKENQHDQVVGVPGRRKLALSRNPIRWIGASKADLESARFFAVPILGPLPEDLNFIP
jgi:hypothetical protein